jgi:hypothetical protein
MSTDIIPYDLYHPHLGYTLAITCLAWVSVALYGRWRLAQRPKLRSRLYALAIAGSTLADTTQPGRLGSSSQWSAAKLVTPPDSTSLLLTPDIVTFTAVLTGTPPPPQHLAVTVPADKPGLPWQAAVSTTDGLAWLGAAPGAAAALARSPSRWTPAACSPASTTAR